MKKFIVVIALLIFATINLFAQTQSDAALAQVASKDRLSRDASGGLQILTASEHAFRADVYSTNRQFPQAREHWQKIFENYPTDASMPKALMGTGRSYMWERNYSQAIVFFDRVVRDFANTKEGRESLAFKGACLVRLGKNSEAANTYQLYTTMYPTGERVETSYLNIIDALREAKKFDEANVWVDKTRTRFSDMPTETNALQARLRMEIGRQNWQKAIESADALRSLNNFRSSMTSLDEVNY
ncbi:MAG: tetratricopeptide repeat protein, partial [Acidobacteriota bacterium]|nr:tetratricopeptide repeat protein [Acidobacteriota bacterium]